MLFKKSQGMSINIIIIAIIALLVLLVLSYIFVGKISEVRKGIDSCEKAGGSCKAICGENEQRIGDKDCNNDGDKTVNEGALEDGICCIRI